MHHYPRAYRVGSLSTLIAFSLAASSQAQTYSTYKSLHAFGETITYANGKTGPDGSMSQANVVFDSTGNMYGTTSLGGQYGQGIVWEITKTGVYKDLHDFGGTVILASGATGPDGIQPNFQVTFDKAGNMYGTAAYGGVNSSSTNQGGNLWEITKSGEYKDLHDFGGTATDGQNPGSGVTIDNAGNLYGTTYSGGANSGSGMLWEYTKSGKYKDVHDFGGTITNTNGSMGPDGANSNGPVAFDSAGNLFGTTINGGPNTLLGTSCGMLWELTKSGVYQDLHDFGGTVKNANGKTGTDGINPFGGVAFDMAGNMFGTTLAGGPNYVSSVGNTVGIVWELTKTGTYKDLHDFGGQVVNSSGTTGSDGYEPWSPVLIDHQGNLFGTTAYGGQYALNLQLGLGIAWEITKAGTYKDLYDFYTVNAILSGVTLDSQDNLYGTSAATGGAFTGNVWELSPSVTVDSFTTDSATTTLLAGQSYTGTLTIDGTSIAGTTFTLTSSNPLLKVPATVKIASLASLVTFPITTSDATHIQPVTITAKSGAVVKMLHVTVAPLALATLAISPTSVQGGGSATVTGTITLNGPAPSAGAVVSLSSSNSTEATVPATITVASGANSATFTVKTSAVSHAKSVTIKASYGGVTMMSTLKVTP